MNLKLGFIQSKLFWQDISANLQSFEKKVNEFSSGEVDIIILPEMFTTGFSMETNLAEPMEGMTVKWMKQISMQKQAAIAGSIMIIENDFVFNRLLWVYPDGTLEKYDKRHLFRMANENDSFQAGKKRLIIDYKGWKICPMICYDLRFPVWSRNTAENEELAYDLLIYVANWPEKRALAWNSLLPARAIENQAFVLGVNRVGSDGNGINYAGDSGLYNYLGEKISHASRYTENMEIIELDKSSLIQYRNSFPAYQDADKFNISI